jgi:hypothetical protein
MADITDTQRSNFYGRKKKSFWFTVKDRNRQQQISGALLRSRQPVESIAEKVTC